MAITEEIGVYEGAYRPNVGGHLLMGDHGKVSLVKSPFPFTTSKLWKD